MQWALINRSADTDIFGNIGCIWNIIVYDGVSPYTPPDPGLQLEQVPDTAQIGDSGY